jgi:phosphatidylglycerol:prolipoprotein diacylglycerol transferase
MYQDLFKIPYLNFPVHSFGVMLVIGFMLAMSLAKVLARRSRIDPEIIANAALIALVAGVIGARLSHVLENWAQYTDPHRSVWANFREAINITEGGLTYYGGFLLATAACVGYGLWKRVPIRTGMDLLAPCIMIGLGFGRIGCFLNGCCYGAECNLPWAVQFPYHSYAFMDEYTQNTLKTPVPVELLSEPNEWGERYPLPVEEVGPQPQLKSNPLHPAQLYSAFTAFLLAGMLFAYFTLPHVPGRVFALMMAVEGVCRFLLELLRAEPRRYLGYTASLGMVQGILIAAGGLALWVIFGLMRNHAAKPQAGQAIPRTSAIA